MQHGDKIKESYIVNKYVSFVGCANLECGVQTQFLDENKCNGTHPERDIYTDEYLEKSYVPLSHA